jgi:AcrR family transcriptional regulator
VHSDRKADYRCSMGVRDDQRRRTRDAILAAAGAEVAEHGYEGTSYQAVAARAGVTKSLVSYHFATKADIARAILDLAYATGSFARTPRVPDAPLEELTVAVVLVASQTVMDPIARAALRLQRERDVIEIEVPPPWVGWVKRVGGCLDRAIELGVLPAEVDVAFEARLLVAQYIGLRELSQAFDERELFVERAIRGTVDLLRALGADPGALDRARRAALETIPEELGWRSE